MHATGLHEAGDGAAAHQGTQTHACHSGCMHADGQFWHSAHSSRLHLCSVKAPPYTFLGPRGHQLQAQLGHWQVNLLLVCCQKPHSLLFEGGFWGRDACCHAGHRCWLPRHSPVQPPLMWHLPHGLQCAGYPPAARPFLGCSCAERQRSLCCLQGLAFMHSMHRLHQSLGPGSVILSTHQEIDAPSLQVQLRDLAFAVDIRSVLRGCSKTHSAASGARLH